MGIRMYQEVGLKPEAIRFIEENAVQEPDQICPYCKEVISYKPSFVVYEKVDSFYGDGPALREFKLKDGRIAREVVQAEPWSSGPVSFFCLEVDGVRVFEWSEEEIDDLT